MSNWADDYIAAALGFKYCVLFPRAREAIKAWTEITGKPIQLPSNVCPVAKDWAASFTLHEIDETGLAPGVTTQLYGYREEGDGNSQMDLDPLGTAFFARPCAASSIVSFGEKKFVCVGGAAFSTNDQGLAEEMEGRSYFPKAHTATLKVLLNHDLGGLDILRDKLRTKVYQWDRNLGDCLQRIKREQVVPWRVMRVAPMGQREKIVRALREEGHAVGTNYPALPGYGPAGFFFGDRVLNFFVSEEYSEGYIRLACDIIKRALA